VIIDELKPKKAELIGFPTPLSGCATLASSLLAGELTKGFHGPRFAAP